MKITLRKANAIQRLINEKLNNTTISSVATIGKFQDAEETVKTALLDFAKDFNTKQILISVLYSIRHKIAESSHEAGIDHLLTELASLTKLEDLYKSIPFNNVFYPGPIVLNKMQEDLSVPSTSAYGRKETFNVSIFSKEEILTFGKNLANLRKEKQRLSDKLLEKNVHTEIELYEPEEKILKELDIL